MVESWIESLRRPTSDGEDGKGAVMELQEVKERYADLLAAESTVEAYLLDGALYYRYEWLNEVEMMPEIVYYRLIGDERSDERGEIVPLGRYYKAQKNGDKVK